MKAQNLKDAPAEDESGQDLIEYALALALIALAATVSIKTLATAIGAAFSLRAAVTNKDAESLDVNR